MQKNSRKSTLPLCRIQSHFSAAKSVCTNIKANQIRPWSWIQHHCSNLRRWFPELTGNAVDCILACSYPAWLTDPMQGVPLIAGNNCTMSITQWVLLFSSLMIATLIWSNDSIRAYDMHTPTFSVIQIPIFNVCDCLNFLMPLRTAILSTDDYLWHVGLSFSADVMGALWRHTAQGLQSGRKRPNVPRLAVI